MCRRNLGTNCSGMFHTRRTPSPETIVQRLQYPGEARSSRNGMLWGQNISNHLRIEILEIKRLRSYIVEGIRDKLFSDVSYSVHKISRKNGSKAKMSLRCKEP
jgi:hypothetical protein